MRKEEVNSNCDSLCANALSDVGAIFTTHVACKSSVLELKIIISVHTSIIIVADSEPGLIASEDRAIST
jgi:hypothetical protein